MRKYKVGDMCCKTRRQNRRGYGQAVIATTGRRLPVSFGGRLARIYRSANLKANKTPKLYSK